MQTVSLFIPCLVDQVCPEIGLSMANVLRRLGLEVKYDPRQTCCGQPAFNTGYRSEALRVANHFLDVFGATEALVAPSGSCVAMVRNFYPALFTNHPRRAEAVALGGRVFELSEFLVHKLHVSEIQAEYHRKACFHNSCHSLRELGLNDEPLTLLRSVKGLELIEQKDEPVCCGFGGLFSAKFPSISSAMTRSRIETYAGLGAEAIISNDPGCIQQMRQEAQSLGSKIEILHLAEVLDQPSREQSGQNN